VAVFLLIRHGHNDVVGRTLAGRKSGIHLNATGKDQAEKLVERLSEVPIQAIFSSPMERTRETAEPLARNLGLEIGIMEDITEIDFGEWAGRSFEDLENDPEWRHFNTFRSGTRIPGGELMVEVQNRMVTSIEKLRKEFPDKVIALFSHGDPIKTVIGHYAGIPLDFALRLHISLASVSVVAVHDYGPRIFCINNTGNFPFFE